MTTAKTRFLVIGAGVNGSAYATILSRAGADVTLLARGRRCQEIRDHGVIIEDPFTHAQTRTQVPVIDCLAPDDVYDYIIVFVRKNQAAALLPVLAANRSQTIVFSINNASGTEEWTAALGKERVMLGSGVAGGKKVGEVVHAVIPKRLSTPYGEINGAVSPRLRRLVQVLRSAGIKASVSTSMPDFWTNHSFIVPLVALPVMRHGGDLAALAASTEELRLIVDAVRQALGVLRALGHRIVPSSTGIVRIIPRFFIVMLFRRMLATKFVEVGLVWHTQQAPDEMMQLAEEAKALVAKSGLPVPAIRRVLEME